MLRAIVCCCFVGIGLLPPAIAQSTRPADSADDDWERVEVLWVARPPQSLENYPRARTLKDVAVHDAAMAERIRRALLDSVDLDEPMRSEFLHQWGTSFKDMESKAAFSDSSQGLGHAIRLHGDDEELLAADLRALGSSVKLAARLFRRWPPLSKAEADIVAAQWNELLADFKAAALESGYPDAEVEQVIRKAKKRPDLTVGHGAFGPFRFKPLSAQGLAKLRQDMRRLLRSRTTQPATESSLAPGRRVDSQVGDVYMILRVSSLAGSPAD